MTEHARTFADTIAADGPEPVLADELRLFGQFVGSWRLAGAARTAPAPAWS